LATLFRQKHCLIRDSVIEEDFQNIIARLLIKKGKSWIRKNLKYLSRKANACWKKNLWRSVKSVPQQTAWTARKSVQTPVSENQCSISVRTAQRMRTTESTHLQGCLDAKVKIANGEDFSCNCPNPRSSRPYALQQNIRFIVAHPDVAK
jgi:hypothetical protein